MYLEGNVNSNTGGSGGFVLAVGSANGGNCGQDFGGTAGRAPVIVL